MKLWKLAALLVAVLTPIAALAQEAFSVAGRVVASGGAPIAEAQVQLLPALDPADLARLALAGKSGPEPIAKAVTAADGSYRLLAPKAGLYSVRVTAPGCAPTETVSEPLVEEVILPDAELARDAGLLVAVSSGGKPIAGALVQVEPTPRMRRGPPATWRAARQFAVSGPDGAVHLARSASDSLDLSAAADGYAVAARSQARGSKAILVLDRGRALPLKILAADGAPASGVLARVGPSSHPVGFTDDAGQMTLRLPGDAKTPVHFDAPGGSQLSIHLAASPTPDAKPRTITLPAVRTLSGKVIDALSRQPVPGALVWERREDRAGSLTDGAGLFSRTAAAQSPARLNALARGYLSADLPDVAPGAAAPVIALRPAAAVEGKVTDADGRPVARAELTVQRAPAGFGPGPGRQIRRMFFGGGALQRPEAWSRDDGSFHLGGLDPETPSDLLAQAKGFAPATVELLGLAPRRTKPGVVVTLTRGASLTGLVVDEKGQPIRGAEISLEPSSRDGSPGAWLRVFESARAEQTTKGVSDGDGRFTVENISPGFYGVAARCRGFATTTAPARDLKEDAPVDIGRIVLEPGVTVDGKVVDKSGRPIEGAQISAGSRDLRGAVFARLLGGGQPDAVTGSDGRFSIPDRRRGEKLEISADREGYASASLTGVTAPPLQPLTITLATSSAIEGRVVDADGKPALGATVMIGRQRARGALMMTAMIGTLHASDADEDGRFRVEDLEPGPVTLRASAPGFKDSRLDSLEIPEGKDLTNVTVTLTAGASLSGHVMGSDGNPAIGAEVAPVGDDAGGPGRGPGARTQTDGDGYYMLDGLGPGQTSIEATAEGSPRAVRDIELKPGSNVLDLQFQGGQDVAGRVVDESGQGVPRADVRLPSSTSPWGGASAVTAEDGSFRLTGVMDGDYQLTASASGYAATAPVPVTVSGQPVAGLEVRLAAGGVITGSIAGAAPEDLPNMTVLAFRSGMGRNSLAGTPDASGVYRVEHVAPGDWVVNALLSSPDGSQRTARGTVTLPEGQAEAQLDLKFDAGFALTGRVVLGSAAVPGAWVAVQGPGRGGAGVQTDMDGRFRVDGLQKGSYTIMVNQFDQGLTHTESVDMQGDKDVLLRIPQMKVAGRTLSGADRSPLAGVTVSLQPLSGGVALPPFMTRVMATSDDSGRFELDNVPAGAYRFAARKEGYAARDTSVTVAQDADANNAEILLDVSDGLVLQVLLPSGRPADRVEAAVLDGAGQLVTGGTYSTGENGAVRIGSVPNGMWEVLVTADGAAPSSIQATAPGGPFPVTLQPACVLDISAPAFADAPGAVTARLTGADGRVFRSPRPWGPPGSDWPLTRGHTQVTNLPPGEFSVVVTSSDGAVKQGTATTQAGAPATVVIE